MTRVILFFLVCYIVYAFYKMAHRPGVETKAKNLPEAKAITKSSCPDPKTFVNYVEGKIDEKQKQDIRKHIDGCKDCMDALQAIFNMPASKPK